MSWHRKFVSFLFQGHTPLHVTIQGRNEVIQDQLMGMIKAKDMLNEPVLASAIQVGECRVFYDFNIIQ